jgi:hypothetical protein
MALMPEPAHLLPPHVEHDGLERATAPRPALAEAAAPGATAARAGTALPAAVAEAAAPAGVHTPTSATTGVLLLLLLFSCCVCFVLQYRQLRKRREREGEPLLAGGGGAPSTPNGRMRQDVAQIGTPARDFVRLSSLPAAVFQLSDSRCRACGQAGECVAFRPCGHAVLCRACSEFVFECPHCGQGVSGVERWRGDATDGAFERRRA